MESFYIVLSMPHYGALDYPIVNAALWSLNSFRCQYCIMGPWFILLSMPHDGAFIHRVVNVIKWRRGLYCCQYRIMGRWFILMSALHNGAHPVVPQVRTEFGCSTFCCEPSVPSSNRRHLSSPTTSTSLSTSIANAVITVLDHGPIAPPEFARFVTQAPAF